MKSQHSNKCFIKLVKNEFYRYRKAVLKVKAIKSINFFRIKLELCVPFFYVQGIIKKKKGYK